MPSHQLEIRDYEILRTLVRVRFLRYAQLSAAFFSTGQAARRRIQRLQSRGLIERHAKGAEPGSNYCAWRITGSGIAELGREDPNEPVPENLDERLPRQSLVENHHREELARLYLGLVVGTERPAVANNDAIRKWSAQLRTRAQEIEWRPDGDVVLHVSHAGEEYRLIPDATAEPRSKRRRLFIELDRSTKGLSSIAETLQHYAAYVRSGYARGYPDGKTPWVVYVVRTEARRTSIARLAEKSLGPAGVRWKVLVFSKDALEWLSPALFSEPPVGPLPTPTGADLVGLIEAHLRASDLFLRDASAVIDEIEQMHPEAVAPWKRSLASLYAAMRPKIEVPDAG